MRIFKTKHFEHFRRKNKIPDKELIDLIQEMEKGLIDANLGNGVFKQRLAKQGQGKSKGYRTFIIYRFNDVAFFITGFEKNQRDNLNLLELQTLRKSADIYLSLTEHQLLKLLLHQKLIEISFYSGEQDDEI